MPEKVVVIKGKDEFSPVAKRAAEQGKTSFEGMKGSALAVGAAVAAITGAVMAMRQALELAREGAQIEMLEQRFSRLGQSMGVNLNTLRQIGTEMGNTKSKVELLEGGVDLLSLGLTKNQDEFRRLMNVSGQLGMNMNQLVLTLTNMTTMRFDALGIQVSGFDQKVKKLTESGMDAADAFREAFLEQAEEQLQKVGSTADTAIGPFQKLDAASANLAASFKKAIAQSKPLIDAVLVLADMMNDAADNQEHFNEANKLGWTQVTKTVSDSTGAIHTEMIWMKDGTELSEKAMYDLVDTTNRAKDAALGYNVVLTDQRQRIDAAFKSWQDARRAVEDYRADLEKLTTQEAAEKYLHMGVKLDLPNAADLYQQVQDYLNSAATGGQQALLLKTAIDTGAIQPEQAADMARQLGLDQLEAQVKLNQTDLDTAKEQLKSVFGLSDQEIASVIKKWSGETLEDVQDRIDKFGITVGKQLGEALDKAGQKLTNQMKAAKGVYDAIVDKEITVTIRYEYISSSHAGGGRLNLGGWTLVGDMPGGTPTAFSELIDPSGYVHDAAETRRILASGMVRPRSMYNPEEPDLPPASFYGSGIYGGGGGGGGGGSTSGYLPPPPPMGSTSTPLPPPPALPASLAGSMSGAAAGQSAQVQYHQAQSAAVLTGQMTELIAAVKRLETADDARLSRLEVAGG